MSSSLSNLFGAIRQFKANHTAVYRLGLLLIQLAGMAAMVESLGTRPLWKFVLVAIGISLWSIAIVDLNYRIGTPGGSR